jgi:purine-binding chemotaxis protein CheW
MMARVQVVTFEINGQKYAVDIFLLDEILPMMEFQEVPRAPDFLRGVINLRGQMVPLVDLRRWFGAEAPEYCYETRILVAHFDERKIGFIVDSVEDVKTFGEGSLRPSVLEAGRAEMISGIGELESGQIVQILRLDKVLDSESLNQLSKLELSAGA